MIIALLVISLLLHGGTVLWIIILMQRQEQPTTFKREMEQIKNEIEDMLVSYTAEMKEDNNRLLKQLQSESQEDQAAIKPLVKSSPKSIPAQYKVEEPEDYIEYSPPVINETENELYEKSVQAEVLILSKQGLTANQIAKKLNIGTGEVELMINFYEKD